MRGWLLAGLASGFWPVPASAAACGVAPRNVAVGGVDGFEAFANPANSRALRANCHIRLYIHDYIWTRLKGGDATRLAILHAFAGTGPAALELGASIDADDYWNNRYVRLYTDLGVRADMASVNGADGLTAPQWRAYVDAGRAHGVKIIAPVFSPNTGGWKQGNFANPIWNDIKAKALYGGGLTIDAPPYFFFWYAPAYRRFVEDEVRWAKANHLMSTWIISPDSSGPHFLSDTQKLLKRLKADRATPASFIVENYLPLPYKPGYLNVVGNDTQLNSVANVGLDVAANEHK